MWGLWHRRGGLIEGPPGQGIRAIAREDVLLLPHTFLEELYLTTYRSIAGCSRQMSCVADYQTLRDGDLGSQRQCSGPVMGEWPMTTGSIQQEVVILHEKGHQVFATLGSPGVTDLIPF